MNKEELYKKYPTIPQVTIETIVNYVEKGWDVGHFITAVLENNLFNAVSYADNFNLSALKEIVMFCFWEIPGNVWGSTEVVKNHFNKFKGEK